MRKLFHEEYADNLNQVRNLLLQYHLEFEQLKAQAKKDFEEGKITKEEYERTSKFRIDEYHTKGRSKSPYSLSKTQVEMIRKYANLDDEGNMMLDSLKEEFVKNQRKLERVFESIRTFNFFTQLELGELKGVFSAIISSDFNEKINTVLAAIESGASEVVLNDKRYKADMLPFALEKLQLHKQEALDRIDASIQEEILAFIAQYYDIDYKYFEWFRVRSLQEAAHDLSIQVQHESRLSVVAMQRESIAEKRVKYQESVGTLAETWDEYQRFMVVANPSMTQTLTEGAQKQGFFSKLFRKKNNLVELNQLFISLMTIPGASTYIDSIKSENENDPFKKYMNAIYPLTNYVDETEFKAGFIVNINNFFKERIAVMKEALKGMEEIIAKEAQSLEANIAAAQEEARYNVEMTRSLSKRISIEGIDSKELDMIFKDMNEYFAQEEKVSFVPVEMRNTDDELRIRKGSTKQS